MRIGKYPILSKEEEATASVESLVLSHGRMVLRHARKYAKYGVDFDDLVQEGNIGLMVAAQKFDASLDVRFSTYAQFWIRSYMRAFTVSNSRAVRIPISAAWMEKFFKGQMSFDLSMDAPLDAERSFGDVIPSNYPTPDELVEEMIDGERMSASINAALASLKPRHSDIFASRFLKDDTETLDQLGSRYGISKERVRQIETEALKRIRREITR